MAEGGLDRPGQNHKLNVLEAIHDSKIRVKFNANYLIGQFGVKVPFDKKDWDTLGEYDNTVNFRFVAAVTGYYHVDSQVYILTNAAASSAFYLYIYINGGAVLTSSLFTGPASTNYSIQLSQDVYLLNTDFLEIYFFQTQGGNITIEKDNTYLDIHRIA